MKLVPIKKVPFFRRTRQKIQNPEITLHRYVRCSFFLLISPMCLFKDSRPSIIVIAGIHQDGCSWMALLGCYPFDSVREFLIYDSASLTSQGK